FGHWGMPAWGIAGAGWATVAGASSSAILALALLLRPRYRKEFGTLSGWRFEADLFARLMRFGFPNGVQWMLDALAFTVFWFLSNDPKWSAVAALVPMLLRFVAVYSLFDSMNMVFSFALRGAGDTRFVTVIAFALAWPLMVLPTWAAWYFGWGIYTAWSFAS